MRPPTFLIALSLAANAVLLGALAWRPSLAPPAVRDFFSFSSLPTSAPASLTPPGSAPSSASPALAATPAPPSLWAALKSDDLRTLIARLRAAGFSPTVARAVIDAHLIGGLNAALRREIDALPDVPYWKSDPSVGNPFLSSGLGTTSDQLYRAYRVQYREALQDEWLASAGEATAEQRRRFGDLPKAKIDLLERINADYDEMSARVRQAAQGIALTEDREKLDLLARERRADLAAALTPAELEDYELRTSNVALMKRNALTLMDATEAEFRAIHRAQTAYNDRLRRESANAGTIGPEFVNEAQDQLAQELRTALGNERFADYRRVNSGDFQQLTRFVQRENLPADTATRAFALRETVAQESTRIINDPTQADVQKRDALKTLAETTRNQLLVTLGSTAGPAYLEVANRWLTPVERGQAVSFNVDGAPRYQPLPTPPPR